MQRRLKAIRKQEDNRKYYENKKRKMQSSQPYPTRSVTQELVRNYQHQDSNVQDQFHEGESSQDQRPITPTEQYIHEVEIPDDGPVGVEPQDELANTPEYDPVPRPVTTKVVNPFHDSDDDDAGSVHEDFANDLQLLIGSLAPQPCDELYQTDTQDDDCDLDSDDDDVGDEEENEVNAGTYGDPSSSDDGTDTDNDDDDPSNMRFVPDGLNVPDNYDELDKELQEDIKESGLVAFFKETKMAKSHMDILLRFLHNTQFINKAHSWRTLTNISSRIVQPTQVDAGDGRTLDCVRLPVKDSIIAQLRRYTKLDALNGRVVLQLSVDGVSPKRLTSHLQLWPMMGCIANIEPRDPFILTMTSGNFGPKHCRFMDPVCEELATLQETGIDFDERHYEVEVHCFIGDLPARAKALGTKGHSGFHSCTRCTIRGKKQEDTAVYFPRSWWEDLNVDERTNDSFRQQLHPSHHKQDMSPSPLLAIKEMDMVKDVVIDYMHNICEGTTKTLMELYFGHDPKFATVNRCSADERAAVDRALVSFKRQLPSNFQRRPRPMNEMLKYTATEWRTWLIYTGPVAMYNRVSAGPYKLFIHLSVALTILLSPRLRMYGRLARPMLLKFLETYERVFGSSRVSMNFHLLRHICDDYNRFGELDNISAFSFENFYGLMSRRIRSGNLPLSQIVNNCSLYNTGRLITVRQTHSVGGQISSKPPNNVFLVRDPQTNITSPCYVNYINDEVVNFTKYDSGDLFAIPIQSRKVLLHRVIDGSAKEESLRLKDFRRFGQRAVGLLRDDGLHVVKGALHYDSVPM